MPILFACFVESLVRKVIKAANFPSPRVNFQSDVDRNSRRIVGNLATFDSTVKGIRVALSKSGNYWFVCRGTLHEDSRWNTDQNRGF